MEEKKFNIFNIFDGIQLSECANLPFTQCASTLNYLSRDYQSQHENYYVRSIALKLF